MSQDNVYKIIITGPFNSGKTQFIQTMSDIPVVSTERKVTTEDRGIKAETTVAMDYGRVALDDKILHLNGTPGQVRFDFMWEILAREMHGFVILVDSTDPGSFPEVIDLAHIFQKFHTVPYLVAANKQDLDGTASLAEVRRGAGVGDDITVMPCVSLEKSSVRQVLLQIISLIDSVRAEA